MPGISHFSKEAIAERFAATIRAQDQMIFDLRSVLRRIVDLEVDCEGDSDEVAANAVSMAAGALKDTDTDNKP